jgi:hypothetical protein
MLVHPLTIRDHPKPKTSQVNIRPTIFGVLLVFWDCIYKHLIDLSVQFKEKRLTACFKIVILTLDT